jgi:hypothetical protein
MRGGVSSAGRSRPAVVAPPSGEDGGTVLLGPGPDGPRRRAQGRSELGEPVLHVRWYGGELLADDDAVALEFPQRVSEDM